MENLLHQDFCRCISAAALPFRLRMRGILEQHSLVLLGYTRARGGERPTAFGATVEWKRFEVAKCSKPVADARKIVAG